MIGRLLLCIAITASTLTGVATQSGTRGTDARPTLIVFKSRTCGPCIAFSRDYADPTDCRFRAAINERFRPLRPDTFAVYVEDQADVTRQYNITIVPTFVIVQDGREVHRITGYTTPAKLLKDLAPPRRQPPPQQPNTPPVSQPRDIPRRNDDSEAESIRRANEALQEERDQQRSLIDSLRRDLGEARSKAQPDTAEVDRLQGQLDDEKARAGYFRRAAEDRIKELEVDRQRAEAAAELERRRIDAIEAERQKAIAEAAELKHRLSFPEAPSHSRGARPPDPFNAGREQTQGNSAGGVGTQPGGVPNISPEMPATTSPDDSTSSQWVKVGKWVATTAITLAAPQYAIPLSVAGTAAGFGVNWWRKRRQQKRRQQAPKPLGSEDNPIQVSDRGKVETLTKYVVSETDILGEAYREAVRRVGNEHRETDPRIIDILQQVDGVAKQLAHGQRIIRRPSKSPTSESIP